LFLPGRERRELETRFLPWVAELCLEAVQVVRPFRSEVMMGVMPGRVD
jgi:hypothetical protein